MKLYFSPGACSLAPRIVLHEAGLPFESEKVDLRSKQYAGGDFRDVNPKGSVPTIRLDNGEVLTENAVILQYLADLKGDGRLLPKPGDFQRYRTLEATNFITTDFHKTYGILFAAGRMVTNPEGLEQLKTAARETLKGKYAVIAKMLEGGNEYLMGRDVSIADAYLYTVTRWSKMMEVDLAGVPAIGQFMSRMQGRPAVKRALEEEGLPPV